MMDDMAGADKRRQCNVQANVVLDYNQIRAWKYPIRSYFKTGINDRCICLKVWGES